MCQIFDLIEEDQKRVGSQFVLGVLQDFLAEFIQMLDEQGEGFTIEVLWDA